MPAHFQEWWQGRGGSVLLVALLLLVLIAAMMLATYTPWTLDQPIQPYDWMIAR
jgi:hypothetical protein